MGLSTALIWGLVDEQGPWAMNVRFFAVIRYGPRSTVLFLGALPEEGAELFALKA
jgi:hypothetical protein